MRLGGLEPTMDCMNRLPLPARFRQAFADGVVVTRGLDGCLYAYRRPDWDRLVESRLATMDPLRPEGRRIQRFFFSGASETELDKQGRVMIPAQLIEHAKLGREIVVAGVNDRLDLGVSSMQIDRPERGFSYTADAPLDMRMDPSAEVTAAGIVNEAAERDLATIFKRYGEERYARQIARAIVRRRKEQPFDRTADLVETIKAAIPAPARFGDGHPAKRVFQALRIAVNDELGSLEAALPSAFSMLRPGGRLAVISFHSLEDRLVKRFMRDLERGCECPPDFPICVCGKQPELRSISRKAIRPNARETAANPRSSSARMRVGVKT